PFYLSAYYCTLAFLLIRQPHSSLYVSFFYLLCLFFFNDPPPTEIYTLSLHDALPISPVIAGDSFEMDAVGALRLSPLRRGLAIDSTVDIFTFYVPHRHVYGEQWIKFMKDGVNATPLPTVNTTGYIDHAAFLG